METPTLLGPLERAGPLTDKRLRFSRVCVFFPSPEDGKRPSFPNGVFSSYLEFRTMDKSTNPAILSDISYKL
jgi:hypothetical protein